VTGFSTARKDLFNPPRGWVNTPSSKCRHPQRKSDQMGVLGETNVISASRFNNL